MVEKISDPQIKHAMGALWAASGDVETFKNKIGVWFDNSMDRLSGWYKRRTQWVSFSVALGIAILLNVNVLYAGTQIWARPAIIADLTAQHFDKDKEALGSKGADTAASNNAAVDQKANLNQEVLKAFNALEPAFLIGWAEGPRPELPEHWLSPSSRVITGWIMAVSSWIIVAGATLFGASFWFDILQRLTHLRGTGHIPKRSKDATAKS